MDPKIDLSGERALSPISKIEDVLSEHTYLADSYNRNSIEEIPFWTRTTLHLELWQYQSRSFEKTDYPFQH